jgi:hypothetical protein
MDGQPVWLCSVSHYSRASKRIVATGQWPKYHFEFAERLAHAALDGVGDPARERAFRMNITFCIHRAVSSGEKANLPASWSRALGGMAGGPVEVLWSRGIEHRPASMPCESPRRLIIEAARPDLWVPEDCGQCAPCRARAIVAESIGGFPLTCGR